MLRTCTYDRFHVRNAIGVTAFEFVYKRPYRSVMYVPLRGTSHDPASDGDASIKA